MNFKNFVNSLTEQKVERLLKTNWFLFEASDASDIKVTSILP